MKNLVLKSILVSVFAFFAIGSMNAQDVKTPLEAVQAEVIDAEVTVEGVVKKACEPGCEKACCAAKEGVGKTACKPGCEKACCAVKEGAEKVACKPGCEKACCTAAKGGKKVSDVSNEVKKSCAKGSKKSCSKSKKAEAKA